jgi:hypothetical protein
LKRKRKRGNRIRKGLRIKRKARGLWAKVTFFLSRSRTGEGGRGGLGPVAGGGIQGPAAVGDRGKRKRGTRACFSRAHIGQRWVEEVPPRQGAAGGGGWWRRRKLWCGRVIERYWKLAAGVRSGEEGCRPFIGRVGRFGGGDFSGGDGSGELKRLLEAVPGDETARRGGMSTCAGEGTARRGACSGGAVLAGGSPAGSARAGRVRSPGDGTARARRRSSSS